MFVCFLVPTECCWPHMYVYLSCVRRTTRSVWVSCLWWTWRAARGRTAPRTRETGSRKPVGDTLASTDPGYSFIISSVQHLVSTDPGYSFITSSVQYLVSTDPAYSFITSSVRNLASTDPENGFITLRACCQTIVYLLYKKDSYFCPKPLISSIQTFSRK